MRNGRGPSRNRPRSLAPCGNRTLILIKDMRPAGSTIPDGRNYLVNPHQEFIIAISRRQEFNIAMPQRLGFNLEERSYIEARRTKARAKSSEQPITSSGVEILFLHKQTAFCESVDSNGLDT